VIQLLRNARLAAGGVLSHLSDDPVILFLQMSRRLPAAALPLARLVCRYAPRGSVAVPVLLASLTRGDSDDLKRRLQLASDRNVKGEQARRLADIALAANLPELADVHLSAARGAAGLESSLARRFSYDGAVSDAVGALKGPGAAGNRQRARLAGELALLEGWAPSLGRRPGYSPVARRVLHVLTNSLPHTSSGYAQRSHSILLAQQQAGWEVLAVTRLGYPVQVGKLFARPSDVVDGIRYQRLLPAKLASTSDARVQQQANELLRVALEFKPSVLHTTTHYVNALVVRAVAEALGIPWVYEVRGQLADTWASTRGPGARNSERYRLFRDREAEVMAHADVVVTLGQAMKANIVAAGIPEGKIVLAPNAVGGDYLDAPMDTTGARRELGLVEGGQYIGTVSSLVPYEGIEDLIAAFALLAPNHPDLRLLIVGDGASKPALQELARECGFRDRISFPGRVPREQTARYHQALDVFVVPRKDLEVTRSVTPLKPVEALACARPVVASRLPALEEIVIDGTHGLLANAGDSHDIATKLETLLGSEELRVRLGQAGRRAVLNNRTWTANALSMTLAYEQLMEARS
jgi:glycosyltransferase involved in cell wall biosynthesis